MSVVVLRSGWNWATSVAEEAPVAKVLISVGKVSRSVLWPRSGESTLKIGSMDDSASASGRAGARELRCLDRLVSVGEELY